MDYEDMERKIKENHIHAAVFCKIPRITQTGRMGALGNRKSNGTLPKI